MSQKIAACLERLNKGLNVLDLDKWLLKTGGLYHRFDQYFKYVYIYIHGITVYCSLVYNIYRHACVGYAS